MRILVYLLLLFFISSCGLFHKAVDKRKFRDRSEIDTKMDSSVVRVDTSQTEATELVEIVFRIGKDRVEGNHTSGQNTKPAEIKTVTASEVLDRLIDRSKEVTVRVDKKTIKKTGISERANKSEVVKEILDLKEKTIERQKESNTTVSANFPWHYTAGILIVVAILLFIFVRRFKLLTIVRSLSGKKPP